MLTLYHAPMTRSVRPRWLLEELGVPYELVRMNLPAADQKRPEYLRLNPNGTVPTLVDDGVAIWESAAIVQYLADKFPEQRLAPPPGSRDRGRYYQWCFFAMCGLEPPAITLFHHTVRLPEAERLPQLVAPARSQLAAAIHIVEDALAGQAFILGPDFSAADVLVGSTLWWCQMMGYVGSEVPKVQAYLACLAARPPMQRATAD